MTGVARRPPPDSSATAPGPDTIGALRQAGFGNDVRVRIPLTGPRVQLTGQMVLAPSTSSGSASP